MKGNKIFDSKLEKVGSFAGNVDERQIKNEPMLFNCRYHGACRLGGPITRSFLANLPDGWKDDVVIDTRVHMLMPGWFPAIPGYHHDDVPRPPIPVGQHFSTAGQPNYDDPEYYSEHILGLVGADVSPTNFALGVSEFNQVPDGEIIYRQWHKEVEGKLVSGELELVKAEDRTLYKFDWQTWHTCQAAVKHGWRWFGRISRNTDRAKKTTDEIRVNAQVYMELPYNGW